MFINKLPRLCFALMMLAAFVNLAAWSVSDSYLGNFVSPFAARNMGMGYTGVYDQLSPMSIAINPANVTAMQNRFGVDVSGLFTRNSDDRSLPLYDSFDAYLDDQTYSANLHYYTDLGFAAYGKLPLGSFTHGVAAYYHPVVNFQGDYSEEVRNNRNSDDDTYPEILAMNTLKNTGALNGLGFTYGAGYNLTPTMSIHAALTYELLNGTNKQEKSIHWSDYAVATSLASSATNNTNVLPDSVFTSQSDLNGGRLKAGLDWRINDHLGIGVAYSLKSSMDRDTNLRWHYAPSTATTFHDSLNTSTDTYILPARLRMGFNYQPQNVMKTYFNAEVEYVKWDDVCDMYDNSWDINVGVEHNVVNRFPLRLGFASATQYLASPDYKHLDAEGQPGISLQKVITPTITTGSSVSISKNLVLDLGLGYSWREYSALDMFRDKYYDDTLYHGGGYILWPNTHIHPTDRDWSNADKVRESFVQFTTGLTYRW